MNQKPSETQRLIIRQTPVSYWELKVQRKPKPFSGFGFAIKHTGQPGRA